MQHLTSEALLSRTKSLVAQERHVTLALIEHLEEIRARMLYAELGYASLWEFATQELGLSEGAAQRRIQAMRLVRDVPEAKAALGNGKLSLSNAAKVQSFRQAEKKLGRKPDPRQLVAHVQSLSQRECEKKLFEISPQALPRERERIVSADGERELKIVVNPALYEKLTRLKGLLAHAIPNATYEELLDRLASEALARIEKKKGIDKSNTKDNAATSPNANDATGLSTAAAAVTMTHTTTSAEHGHFPGGKRIALPAALKRTVWTRGGGQCEFQTDGRRCSSKHSLEVDHIQPLALGGANTLLNLRLLCRQHNQQQAREKLGARSHVA